jgi:hypothetical protein
MMVAKCKMVKLQPLNIIVPKNVTLREQGQLFLTPKQNYFHLFTLLQLQLHK